MYVKHLIILVVLLFAPISAPLPVQAGGVVTVCDESHLLAALAGGGTVTFACSGTIILTAEIVIADDTTIDGSGQDVTISGNDAVRVFTVNAGVTLSLNDVTVANGYTSNGGGAGIDNSGGTVIVSNSTLINNFAAGMYGYSKGGGIRNSGGTVIASNSTFSNNRTYWDGGGIANVTGTVTITNSSFVGNSALDGGGIATEGGGTVEVRDTTFSGNLAYSWGGGMWNSYGGVTVSNSTFVDNSAEYGGGIGTSWDAMLSVSNSTFFHNSADDYSGGIFNGGTGTISNCTFYDNGASRSGGGITNGSTLMLRNTIVADSPTGGNCYGVITDGGGNLSYPDTTCPGINADPMLGPLQLNGGPTLTMDLGPGSAAIDAGDDAICAADPVNNLDQRGVVRPQGAHCDSGALEQLRKWLPVLMVTTSR